MNDKDVVLEKYPKARIQKKSVGWVIRSHKYGGIIGTGYTEDEAWSDASNRAPLCRKNLVNSYEGISTSV